MATVVIRSKGKSPLKFSKGGLHRTTGTPAGQKIPASKIRAARSGKFGPKGKKQAAFMRNVLTGPK